MYNYFIKFVVFYVCFAPLYVYAGKKIFPNKTNVSSSVSEALNQKKNDAMHDPILESCMTTLVRSQAYQNKLLKNINTEWTLGCLILPKALQRSESVSEMSSRVSSVISSTASSFSKK